MMDKVKCLLVLALIFFMIGISCELPTGEITKNAKSISSEESPEVQETIQLVGDGYGQRQKRQSCFSWNSDEHCKKECRTKQFNSTEICYCEGSCQWTEQILSCLCTEPKCDCE